MMSESSPVTVTEASHGLLPNLQSLFGTLVAIFHTRLSLLSVELEEEKLRLLQVLAWGAVAFLLGCVGLIFLAGFITVLFWEEHRLLVLGALTALFIGGCALAAWRVGRHLQASTGLLKATLAELDQDRQALTGSGS